MIGADGFGEMGAFSSASSQTGDFRFTRGFVVPEWVTTVLIAIAVFYVVKSVF